MTTETILPTSRHVTLSIQRWGQSGAWLKFAGRGFMTETVLTGAELKALQATVDGLIDEIGKDEGNGTLTQKERDSVAKAQGDQAKQFGDWSWI